MNARAAIPVSDVMVARHRWKRKILMAVSRSVSMAYEFEDGEAATAAMLDRWPRLEAAATAMANDIVDGLLNVSAPLVPSQRPASTRPPIRGGYLSSVMSSGGKR